MGKHARGRNYEKTRTPNDKKKDIRPIRDKMNQTGTEHTRQATDQLTEMTDTGTNKNNGPIRDKTRRKDLS